MNPSNVLTRLSPSITTMIRMDHSHVLVTFHKYQPDLSPGRKQAIVQTCCRALEIHAQLEEEIFYPALGGVDGGEVLDKSRPEHDEMRRLIGKLRDMEPTDTSYDDTFHQLIRDVMHHVADEETVLLPEAERLLKDRLADLGAQMTRRRMQLVGPHAGEIAVNTARAMPMGAIMLAGGVLAGLVLVARRAGHRSAGSWQHTDRRYGQVDRRSRIRERERTEEQPELLGL
jgi:hemerythrin superfamily protein